MPRDFVLLVEYKPFEPAFYHTDIADWGMAFLLAKAVGPQAISGSSCASPAASTVADPPRMGIFFTFPSTQNASHSPSGEKLTSEASSVPVTGRSVRSSIRRMEMSLFAPLLSIVASTVP